MPIASISPRSKKTHSDVRGQFRYFSISRRRISRAKEAGSGRGLSPRASRSAMMARADSSTVAWPRAASSASSVVLPAPGPPDDDMGHRSSVSEDRQLAELNQPRAVALDEPVFGAAHRGRDHPAVLVATHGLPV